MEDRLASVKDRWSGFCRLYFRLSEKPTIQGHEDDELSEMRKAVQVAFGRLSDSERIRCPKVLKQGIDELSGFERLSSLSDTELESQRKLIVRIDRGLDDWLQTVRRKGIFVEDVIQRQRKHNFGIFIVTPVVFGLLVALFVFLSVKFYLNR
jgi:hypothetical protein